MTFYDINGNAISMEYTSEGEPSATLYNLFGVIKKRPIISASPRIRSSVFVDVKDKIVTLESLDVAMKNQRDLRIEGDDALFEVIDGMTFSGSNNYEDLINKPQIESTELIGNKTFNDLNMTKITLSELENFFSNQ